MSGKGQKPKEHHDQKDIQNKLDFIFMMALQKEIGLMEKKLDTFLNKQNSSSKKSNFIT